MRSRSGTLSIETFRNKLLYRADFHSNESKDVSIRLAVSELNMVGAESNALFIII
jgi:hypothetical protein